MPIANVGIDTPYFTGNVEALCPIYDLILGNVRGARAVGDPYPNWLECAIVATLAQLRKTDDIKPLAVSEGKVWQEVSGKGFSEMQREDNSIRKYWQKMVPKKWVIGRLHLHSVLFRIYAHAKVIYGRPVRRFVVPKQL